jgi:hypothetical protein
VEQGPAPTPHAGTAAAALGAAVFAVYALTLHPSVPGGDSGELIAAACRAGVAHPPGYPLFVLLGKVFSLLPVGGIAWRVNLLSAVCGAWAAAALSLAVTRAARGSLNALAAGCLAGGLFAFSPLAWTYGTQAEVFALNHALVATLLWLAIRYTQEGSLQVARAAALVIGLGLANHHAFVFVAVPAAAWALVKGKETLARPRELGILLGLALAGMSPYLVLPFLGARAPLDSWGDLTSWSGFAAHFLRKEYGTFQLGADAIARSGGFGAKLWAYLGHLPGPLLLAGVPLAAAGALAAWRSLRWTVAAFLLYVILFHALSNLSIRDPLMREVQARFWLQADLLVFAWLGLGFARLAIPGRAAAGLAAAAVALAVGLQFRAHDQRGNRVVEALGRSILDSLPKDALLLVKGDIVSNSVRYLQRCEGARPDVRAVDQEMMSYRWFVRTRAAALEGVVFPGVVYNPFEPDGFSIRAFLDANLDRAPVFVAGGYKDGDSSHEGAFVGWPHGFVDRVYRKDRDPTELGAWLASSAPLVPRADAFPGLAARASRSGSWEALVATMIVEASYRRGYRLLGHALDHGDDPSALTEAARLFEAVITEKPELQPFVYKNLGIAYSRLASRDPAAPAKMVEAWRRYLDRADPGDKDLPAIRQAVGR